MSTIKNRTTIVYAKLRDIGAIRAGGNPRILLIRWFLEYQAFMQRLEQERR